MFSLRSSVARLLALCGMLLAAAPTAAATFSLEKGEDGFDFIFIEGEIHAGDEDHFRRLAVGSDQAAVVISGPGGALIPALEIGKTIQLKGFATYVPDSLECTSACALIWVAGNPRYLSNSSQVGFHASYRNVDGQLEEVGVANAIVGRYLTLLNLPEKAVIFATSASPNSVSWLDQGNSSQAGIDFEFIDLQTDSSPSSEPVAQSTDESPSDGFRWEDDSWSVWTNFDGSSCGVMRLFTSERGIDNISSVAAVVPWTGDNAILLFQNEKFRSLSSGETYSLEVVFLKGDQLDTGWGLREFVAEDDMLRVFLSWADLGPDLRSADTIGFFRDDELIDAYELDGSSRALDQLEVCRKVNGGGLADPFSRR